MTGLHRPETPHARMHTQARTLPLPLLTLCAPPSSPACLASGASRHCALLQEASLRLGDKECGGVPTLRGSPWKRGGPPGSLSPP